MTDHPPKTSFPDLVAMLRKLWKLDDLDACKSHEEQIARTFDLFGDSK